MAIVLGARLEDHEEYGHGKQQVIRADKGHRLFGELRRGVGGDLGEHLAHRQDRENHEHQPDRVAQRDPQLGVRVHLFAHADEAVADDARNDETWDCDALVNRDNRSRTVAQHCRIDQGGAKRGNHTQDMDEQHDRVTRGELFGDSGKDWR
jgi:hypothetical protein